MRATHVVSQDLQAGNGICARIFAQDEIPVHLIAVGTLSPGRDVDHALPHGTASLRQCPLEEQITRGMCCEMVLLRVMVEMLCAVGDVKS